MSSIPVKKNVKRRSGSLKENAVENSHDAKASTVTTKHKENKTRPFLRQGSKKELEDENTRLKDLVQNHEQKLQELESKMAVTEKELTKASNEAVQVKETWEKKLLTSNIDPVTMKQIKPTSEQENEIQQCRDKAKSQVAALKEKLQNLNSWTEGYINDLENISSQLEPSNEEW